MYGHQTRHAHDKGKVQNLAPLYTKNYLSNCRYRPLSAIKSQKNQSRALCTGRLVPADPLGRGCALTVVLGTFTIQLLC